MSRTPASDISFDSFISYVFNVLVGTLSLYTTNIWFLLLYNMVDIDSGENDKIDDEIDDEIAKQLDFLSVEGKKENDEIINQ